jgi:uncharacterized repeat protein (TIGR01451 family)
MSKIYRMVLLVLFIFCAGSAITSASVLFSINMQACDLRVVNTEDALTQAIRLIQSPGVDFECSAFGHGLATDPITGNLYAVVRLTGDNSHRLLRISNVNGSILQMVSIGDSFEGIAFNTNGSILYGVTGENALSPETLFRLDKTTGSRTLACTLGNGDTGETIAWNTDDNLLYHASGDQTKVFEKVNPGTCQITNIGFFPPDFGVGTTALTYKGSGSNTFFFADFSTLFDLTTQGILSNNCDCRFMDHASKGLALTDSTIPFRDVSLTGTCERSGKDVLIERTTIRNLTSSQSTGVIVGSRLPAGVTFVSDSLQKCSVSGSLLTCAIGNVSGMTSIPLDIQYRVSFGRKTKLQQQLLISGNEFETVGTVQNNTLTFNQTCRH